MIFAGTILIYCGIAFLVLGLLAAAKEVFWANPPTTRPRGGAAEGTINDINNLVQTIGMLKTWIALAVIGFLMICLGGVLTKSFPLGSKLTGGAADAQPKIGQ